MQKWRDFRKASGALILLCAELRKSGTKPCKVNIYVLTWHEFDLKPAVKTNYGQPTGKT